MFTIWKYVNTRKEGLSFWKASCKTFSKMPLDQCLFLPPIKPNKSLCIREFIFWNNARWSCHFIFIKWQNWKFLTNSIAVNLSLCVIIITKTFFFFSQEKAERVESGSEFKEYFFSGISSLASCLTWKFHKNKYLNVFLSVIYFQRGNDLL